MSNLVNADVEPIVLSNHVPDPLLDLGKIHELIGGVPHLIFDGICALIAAIKG